MKMFKILEHYQKKLCKTSQGFAKHSTSLWFGKEKDCHKDIQCFAQDYLHLA